MSSKRFAWSLIIVLLGVLLDIREELSFIRQILRMGKGAVRPPDGE